MRRSIWIFLLLVAGCAPITTLQRAEPGNGIGGTVAFTTGPVFWKGKEIGAPYVNVYWGNGNMELGIISQAGVAVYYKQKVFDHFSVRILGGGPLPWVEGGIFYDYQDFTFSGRLGAGEIPTLTEEKNRRLVMGFISASYWRDDLGFEASVLVNEERIEPLMSVGIRF